MVLQKSGEPTSCGPHGRRHCAAIGTAAEGGRGGARTVLYCLRAVVLVVGRGIFSTSIPFGLACFEPFAFCKRPDKKFPLTCLLECLTDVEGRKFQPAAVGESLLGK